MSLENLKDFEKDKIIVLLPKHDDNLKELIESSLGKVFIVDDSVDKELCKEITTFINKSNIKEVIFVNYNNYYRELLPSITLKKKMKWFMTNGVASLTDGCLNVIFNSIMEFYDREIIKAILCIDKGLYELLKKKGYEVEYVQLCDDSKKESTYDDSGIIGILSNDYDPKHGLYNCLTALKLVDYKKVKLISHMEATIHFLKFFDLKYELCESIDEVMVGNTVNLYCNFTNSYIHLIIKSMDMGIPCIVGNCDLFDNYPTLKHYLVLKSDDDVNEIANKIKEAIKNREIIIKEYKKNRKRICIIK